MQERQQTIEIPAADQIPAADRIHPLVYRAMAGLVMCLGFAAVAVVVSGLAGIALTVIGILTLVAAVLLPELWLAWRRRGAADAASGEPNFAEWLAGDFDIWQARLRAGDALVQMLLPIAAVAFGMVAFALALHIAIGA